MNAKELLEYMRDGAILRIRWRNGKRTHSVYMPDGETVSTQASNLEALIKQHKVIGIEYSGNNWDYYYWSPFKP